MAERWSTVYDGDGLQRVIADLAGALRPESKSNAPDQRPFYELSINDPTPCQGDIIRLSCDIPVIDEEGQIAAEQGSGIWLVLGNTCDFARPISSVPWSQVVPVSRLPGDLTPGELKDWRSYNSARRFYLPSWPGLSETWHYAADFTMPVSIHKTAFLRAAKIEARLSKHAWSLLHSCLVRFLARDDGREIAD